MELTYRRGTDAFVPAGSYRRLETRLREHTDDLSEVPAVSLACFDRRTRRLPFVMYDKLIFPAGARAVAGALSQAGFQRLRAVFQLWNPYFRPSRAKIDGRPIQLLLLSSMQIHSFQAAAMIRDAWTMGEDRPLILVGGSSMHYEPYSLWQLESPEGPAKAPVGPDAVCTGEAYVLLDLLNVIVAHRRPGEHIRQSFERARLAGALNSVPGVVYLNPDTSRYDPQLIDTGLQRLVQHLDEMPHEVSSLSLLEPPSWRSGLASAPLADKNVRWHAQVCSLLITQGCKFNCSYCPIPAVNQKTWRYRSPEGLAYELASVRDRFGIKYFFGTDDNFFNRRQTGEEFFQALATYQLAGGKRLGSQIRWGTEATQHDTWKNRDLLPLAREAGLIAIWFGIEDLTAELINKGQKPEITQALFPLMHQHRILPMAMMMFHENQPFRSPPGTLNGITNQIEFLRQAGAVTLQLTIHTPAVGTREYERTFATGRVLKRLGKMEVELPLRSEGNHVLVVGKRPGWLRQLQLLGAYFSFYNPLNLWRAARADGSPMRRYRVGFQIAGVIGAVRTAFKSLPYLWRLLVCKPEYHTETPPVLPVPVRLAKGAFSRLPGGVLQETEEDCAGSKVA